jgi:hypothetical protein
VNEQDRDTVIKEARINVPHDVQQALNKLIDEKIADDDTKRAARLIAHYLGLRLSEVNQDKADRINITHTVWED